MNIKKDLDNIILRLQNNQELHKKVIPNIDNNKFASFILKIKDYIATLDYKKRCYIYIKLWNYWGGISIDDDTFINTYTYYKEIKIEKENIMPIDFNTPVQQITYVFGKDVETMSEQELINAIKQVESEIDQLATVRTQSAKIDLRISEHKETLQKLAKLLDNK